MTDNIIPQDLLVSGAEDLGIVLSEQQVGQLSAYVALLLEWNTRFNLTRITDPTDIVTKHLLDSLMCLAAVDLPEGASVIDVGTGGGLPGIPVKIARPDIKLTLLDSTRKKLAFLEEVVAQLDLNDVRIVHGRAEETAHSTGMREKFDVVIARAVSETRILAEYTIPYLRVGGVLVALKSKDIDEELSAAKKSISSLGGHIKAVKKLQLPHTDIQRSIVIVEKKSPTNRRYPRRHSEIIQKPL
jgi:16S rRNA (guanine527-N7)-methyltransferase